MTSSAYLTFLSHDLDERHSTSKNMIIECPSCSQSLEISREFAGSTGVCPTCGQKMRFPDLESFSEKHSAAPPPILKSRASENFSRSKRKHEIANQSERKFSFRLLLLRVLTALMMVGLAVNVALILSIDSTNYTTGFMGGIQQVFLDKNGIETWEDLTPEIAGMLVGRQILPGLFTLIALIAVFRRMRKTAIVFYSLLVLQHLGALSLPIVPGICLIIASIPGRSKIWQR